MRAFTASLLSKSMSSESKVILEESVYERAENAGE